MKEPPSSLCADPVDRRSADLTRAPAGGERAAITYGAVVAIGEEVGVAKLLVRSVMVVAVAMAALAAIFLLGMRSNHPAVVHRVRRFNRAVTNPRVLRTAGSPGASASVIRHVGRRSGRTYDTPVGPHAIGDHFVIALPYGPGADWVRNVLERGSAEMVHEGRTIELREPEIVSTAEVATQLPSSELRTLRLFDVEQCLRVRGQG
jgi:hypothetical protein